MSNLTTEQIKKAKEQFRSTQQYKDFGASLDAALATDTDTSTPTNPSPPRLTVASTLGTQRQQKEQNKKQLDSVLRTFKTKLNVQPDSILDILYNQKRCPRCNARLQPTPSISGSPSTDWMECSNPSCNTYVDTYRPMLHQASVHRDPHRIIGNFGSYGTGKTKTSEKEIEKHIFITPNANILLGANITSQYEQTILRDFEKSFPEAFLESRSQQKGYLDFINGARIMLRPFDDPDKLRSNNYSLAVIVEASECVAEAFHQIKTRLRNTAATVPLLDEEGNQVKDEQGHPIYKGDWRKLICESNPDSGWIRTDLLLVSDTITQYGRFAKEEYDDLQSALEKDPAISSHVASTDVNTFLPSDYIAVNSRNKPEWWIRRFLYGSFKFAEGLVYPNAMKCVVPTPKDSEGRPLTPRHFPDWRILIAHDYGLMDEATFVYAAVDRARNKLIVYKVDHTNNAALKDLATLFKRGSSDISFGQMYTTPIIDPKNNRRDYDKKDLISHYQDYGITFKPGFINVEARIIRLNDYIEAGTLEIWDCCTFLIKELREYKFKPKTLNEKDSKNVPIDAGNHAINGLEWICMELPAQPNRLYLSGFDQFGRPLDRDANYNERPRRRVWQLEYDNDSNSEVYDQSLAFGIEGGF